MLHGSFVYSPIPIKLPIKPCSAYHISPARPFAGLRKAGALWQAAPYFLPYIRIKHLCRYAFVP